MSRIEKALNIEDDDDANEEQDNKSQPNKLYLVSNEVQEITSRHSANYSNVLAKNKGLKTSNRNDILLGKAT